MGPGLGTLSSTWGHGNCEDWGAASLPTLAKCYSTTMILVRGSHELKNHACQLIFANISAPVVRREAAHLLSVLMTALAGSGGPLSQAWCGHWTLLSSFGVVGPSMECDAESRPGDSSGLNCGRLLLSAATGVCFGSFCATGCSDGSLAGLFLLVYHPFTGFPSTGWQTNPI